MPQKSYTLGNLLQDCLDCDIRKSDIRQFFDDLKKKAHFVYAILCGAPKSVFWITLDDEESHPDEKTFSVAEFNDNYENFVESLLNSPANQEFRVKRLQTLQYQYRSALSQFPLPGIHTELSSVPHTICTVV